MSLTIWYPLSTRLVPADRPLPWDDPSRPRRAIEEAAATPAGKGGDPPPKSELKIDAGTPSLPNLHDVPLRQSRSGQWAFDSAI